ncbi:MAG: competence protein ComEC, partial [Alphaproteobacteria bacterium]|nr:competence protein ComEC [Alphaproteobacteria bacterium]
PDEQPREALFTCDRWTCRPLEGAPVSIAAYWSRRAPDADTLAVLCASAELVIVRPALPPGACPGRIMLSGDDFAQGGSVELGRGRDGVWRAQWAQDLRGRRPWSWGSNGSGE